MGTRPQQALTDLFFYLLTALLPGSGKSFSLQTKNEDFSLYPTGTEQVWCLKVQFSGILEGDGELQDVSLHPYPINVLRTTVTAISLLFFYALK